MTECERAPVFRLTTYSLPTFLKPVAWVVGNRDGSIDFYPFQFHALVFSVFGSLIGPFGGFFASGFKRAFKIKDFADTIPGLYPLNFTLPFLPFTLFILSPLNPGWEKDASSPKLA